VIAYLTAKTMMTLALKKRSLVLLIGAYFIASQATVVCIVAQWYSTSGNAAVAWQSGPIRDYASLSWSPRTHLPFNPEQDLPHAIPPVPGFYPVDIERHNIPSDRAPFPSSAFSPSSLGDRAPPPTV
jgi:hypothetical protein